MRAQCTPSSVQWGCIKQRSTATSKYVAYLARCDTEIPLGTEKLLVKERERFVYTMMIRREVQTEVAENRCLATALRTQASTNTLTDGHWAIIVARHWKQLETVYIACNYLIKSIQSEFILIYFISALNTNINVIFVFIQILPCDVCHLYAHSLPLLWKSFLEGLLWGPPLIHRVATTTALSCHWGGGGIRLGWFTYHLRAEREEEVTWLNDVNALRGEINIRQDWMSHGGMCSCKSGSKYSPMGTGCRFREDYTGCSPENFFLLC